MFQSHANDSKSENTFSILTQKAREVTGARGMLQFRFPDEASNFKNCLLVIGRSLEKLLLSSKNNENVACLSKILTSISRVRQKIRPGRHTPRQSWKPINKWSSSNGGEVLYALTECH